MRDSHISHPALAIPPYQTSATGRYLPPRYEFTAYSTQSPRAGCQSSSAFSGYVSRQRSSGPIAGSTQLARDDSIMYTRDGGIGRSPSIVEVKVMASATTRIDHPSLDSR